MSKKGEQPKTHKRRQENQDRFVRIFPLFCEATVDFRRLCILSVITDFAMRLTELFNLLAGAVIIIIINTSSILSKYCSTFKLCIIDDFLRGIFFLNLSKSTDWNGTDFET